MRGPTEAWTIVLETFRMLILASSMTAAEKKDLLEQIDRINSLEECEEP